MIAFTTLLEDFAAFWCILLGRFAHIDAVSLRTGGFASGRQWAQCVSALVDLGIPRVNSCRCGKNHENAWFPREKDVITHGGFSTTSMSVS